MADTKKCKHSSCNCMVTGGKDYCSTICEDSKGTIELACDCGHPACQGEALTH